MIDHCEDFGWSMSTTYFVLLPNSCGATSQTLAFAEDHIFHSLGSKYPMFLILRHISTVYLFVAMIFFDMDPLCFLRCNAYYFIFFIWIHCVLFVAMEIIHTFICTMDIQCIFFSGHALSLLIMGMPNLGNKTLAWYLLRVIDFWIIFSRTSVDTSMHPHSQSS